MAESEGLGRHRDPEVRHERDAIRQWLSETPSEVHRLPGFAVAGWSDPPEPVGGQIGKSGFPGRRVDTEVYMISAQQHGERHIEFHVVRPENDFADFRSWVAGNLARGSIRSFRSTRTPADSRDLLERVEVDGKSGALRWTGGRLSVMSRGEVVCDFYDLGDTRWIAVADLGDVYLGIAAAGVPPGDLEVIEAPR